MSKDSLVGGIELYNCNGVIIVLQGLDDGSSRCFLLSLNSNSWNEVSLTGVPLGYLWAYPAIDQASDEVFFEQGYIENEQLIMNVLVGRMSGNLAVQDVMEKKWLTDKKTLFGETGSNVQLGLLPGVRDWPSLGIGVINGTDMYIPYCVRGHTRREKIFYEGEGPFNNGVFHSADSGANWQMERVSDFEGWLPSLCKTKGCYYYIAAKNHQKDLWFSRKPDQNASWSEPDAITKTFCNSALYWKYVAAADNDTIHLCWLDRRHEKTRISLEDYSHHNYEVAYCHRKDSDDHWSKSIILSKGLFYSYSPSMSVEGDKIVVAWAGIQAAEDWHNEDNPNDIYYVTSKDGGNTWTEPLKVTNAAKDGVTSGKPEVMLLNGIIHLFYIQGKMDLQQVGGLTKLNQPPWPIYYTQRPFPN
ncbi:MAG TPA: sialidase family protein [Verrucomicrobiae bacterium]|nr:sialidase family protein [Verrucomicrobiae bacterium]